MKFHTSKLSATAAASVLVLASGMANAAVELVANGSFESGAFNPIQSPSGTGINNVQLVSTGSTAITGWNVAKSLLWLDNAQTAVALQASNGSKFLDLTGFSTGVANYASVSQSLSTTSGTAYTLSFDLGSSNIYAPTPVIALTTAGVVVNFAMTSAPTANSQWTKFSYTFTAGSAATPITFTGIQGADYIGLDNVSVTAVPEPSSMAMLFAGLAAVGSVVARRRKSA